MVASFYLGLFTFQANPAARLCQTKPARLTKVFLTPVGRTVRVRAILLRCGLLAIIWPMSVTIEESYQLCRDIARRAGTNFYCALRLMPRGKRDAMYAIYAFMRRSDDIADDSSDPRAATVNLKAWRMAVNKALGGGETDEPVLPALADTVARYQIGPRYFQDLLDGTEMDQTKTRYQTFDDLYQYCYRVASCVGLVVLPIFGYTDPTALDMAEDCGIAFQLTNILRDVKEDAERGRIYLPLEDLAKFGVEESDIMQSCETKHFLELMKFEADRARTYYQRARPLRRKISRDSRWTLGVMMGIYEGILNKIEAGEFAVFEQRFRLNAAQKLWIVAKSLVG